MVLRARGQPGVYQSDRASRTACRTATHPADHTPLTLTSTSERQEIHDAPLDKRLSISVRRLATRHLTAGIHADAEGIVRLIVPYLSFAGYLGLAVGQIWRYGADAVQVRRLTLMLMDIAHAALPEHRGEIERWLSTVRRRVSRVRGKADRQGGRVRAALAFRSNCRRCPCKLGCGTVKIPASASCEGADQDTDCVDLLRTV